MDEEVTVRLNGTESEEPNGSGLVFVNENKFDRDGVRIGVVFFSGVAFWTRSSTGLCIDLLFGVSDSRLRRGYDMAGVDWFTGETTGVEEKNAGL